jgi:Domain of unknown function (DUF2017)
MVEHLPIARSDDGGVDLTLPRELREFLKDLASKFRELLGSEEAADDPAVARLAPTAYPDDPMRNLEFDEAMGRSLADGRLHALDVVQETADAEHLTAEEAEAWMRALNDARLVFGTRLEIVDEDDVESLSRDPEKAETLAVYDTLTECVVMLVEALDATPAPDEPQ